MATPKQQIDTVKDTLRGMGLHGLVSQIDNAWSDLQSNHEHVVSSYVGENMRMRAELRALGVK